MSDRTVVFHCPHCRRLQRRAIPDPGKDFWHETNRCPHCLNEVFSIADSDGNLILRVTLPIEKGGRR